MQFLLIFPCFPKYTRDVADFEPMCMTLTFDLDLDLVQGRVKAKPRKIGPSVLGTVFVASNLLVLKKYSAL